MMCEDAHLPAASGTERQRSVRGKSAATRIASTLWLLLTLLVLQWAVPPGHALAAVPSAQGALGGGNFGSNQRSSEPALLQRLLALPVAAEVRHLPGKRDPSTSDVPPIGLAPFAAWRPEAGVAAHRLIAKTTYRPAAPRYFEARGPPHFV